MLPSLPCKTERQLQSHSGDDNPRRRPRQLRENFARIFAIGRGNQNQPCLENEEGVYAIQNATQLRLGEILQDFGPDLENQINREHGQHRRREDKDYPGNQQRMSPIGGRVEDIGIKAGVYRKQ
jgi:hypothetical protein